MYYVYLSNAEWLSLEREIALSLTVVNYGASITHKDTYKTKDFGLYMTLMSKFDVKSLYVPF